MRSLGTMKAPLAFAVATLVAAAASNAVAFSHGGWGSYGGYGGSYGSYGSYGGSSSYGSYGSYGSSGSASYGSGSYGSSGRVGLFARWHAKKAARYASAGSSGSYGSSGGYASSGSSGSYGSSGSSGSSGSYGGEGVIYDSAPVEAEPSSTLPPAASIRVTVPEDAKVFVNNLPTTSTGAERTYVSRGLRSGATYSYQVRVEFTRDGKPMVENKSATLRAGDSIDLAFGGNESATTETVRTELKLHVPAKAKVTLAGAATEQTGELRTYATSTLASGQVWNGYVVRVELNENGKTQVQEKTLKIEGGQTYELTIDFADAANTVAAVN